ncbi:Olfactory receptor, partial [Ophiophagus hannah]
MDPFSFCGSNIIDHYFCDFLPLEKLSCSNRNFLEPIAFFMTVIFTIAPFLLTLISYICIIGTIIKIKSNTGRQKAFSTCSSHLIVVCLYYGTLIIVYLSFCGPNVIDHYFCDFHPLEKLSCSDTNLLDLVLLFISVSFVIVPFLLTFLSYICIIGTIIKIKSTIGRQKAFSTCSSHLMVVCLFYGTLIIVYVLPDYPTLRYLNKVFSIFYTVMTPLANPLIYTLRNKEVHKALRLLYVIPFLLSIISYTCIIATIIKIQSTTGRQKAFSTCSSHLMKLSCTDTSLIELIAFCEAVIFIIVPFLLTITSYVCIIGTIIKIKSSIGRQKAFSTCSSHLLVVSLFYSTLIIVYVMPDTPSLRPLNKIFSIFYTVMTSLFNPLIYTLRNKEVHKAIKRLFNKILMHHMNHLNFQHLFTSLVCKILISTKKMLASEKGNQSDIIEFILLEKLSCTDTSFLELIVSLLSFIDAVIPFILTSTSYICIITVIIKIKSSTGRQKAFSNCSSHLMVVCLFYGTIIIVYMLPDTPTLRHLNKFFSIFYTILTPLVNPIIYTLRNKDVHKALGWVQKKLRIFGRTYFF